MGIVDLSLSTGECLVIIRMQWSFPSEKIFRPIILNNFRPIWNLVYLSKLIEKVIAYQLHNHMTNSDLYEELQALYIKFHSSETALTCAHYDI